MTGDTKKHLRRHKKTHDLLSINRGSGLQKGWYFYQKMNLRESKFKIKVESGALKWNCLKVLVALYFCFHGSSDLHFMG